MKSKDSSEGDGVGAGDDQTSQTDSSSTQDLDSAQEPSTETLNDVTSPIPTHSLHSSKPAKPTSLTPDSPAITDSSGTPGTSHSKATGAPGTSMQTSVPAAAVSYIPTGPPMPSSVASGSSGSLNLTPAQYATSSRAAVPSAAIAIPLALVGTTLLISLILCFAHRRSLAAQKRRNSVLIASQQGPGAPPAAVQAVPSLTSLPSSSTVPDDIEKAISALNGTDAPHSASKHGSVVYVPVSVPQQRTHRRDVRRDRVHTYERSYTPSIASSQYSCRDIQHEYGRTPAQEYASSFPLYLDRNNPRDYEPDDISTTGSVLSDYLSPSNDESCTSRRGDYPRPVPRSHSRATAPCVEDAMYSRQDVYEVVNRVLANSPLRGIRR